MIYDFKIPKKKSIPEILKYFKKYKLSFISKFNLQNKKISEITSQKSPYKPDLIDLYNLHEFIIINKRLTVLEFGCG